MAVRSPVLLELARRYRRRLAGRTGQACRAVVEDLEELLASAGCAEGDPRAAAEQALRDAERAGVLRREPHHPRDPEHIARIRVMPEDEADFFRHVGETAPSELRRELCGQLERFRSAAVPERWRSGWERWLARLGEAALAGASVEPLHRDPGPANDELLRVLVGVLGWRGESLVRFASCVLCGHSKRLEALAARLEKALPEITAGEVVSLEQLGIVRNPRSVLLHGPIRLLLDGQWLDLGRLAGPFRLSEADLRRAVALEVGSRRCVTVENETTFHELAKLGSGDLLVQTSHPGSGTLALMQRLPPEIECHHFGDSDPAGFAILEDLRARTGRDFRPLHMEVGRMPFEQEALGRPDLPGWPYYSAARGPAGKGAD